jgi:AraC family transcriptional regulator of arabinose operon
MYAAQANVLTSDFVAHTRKLNVSYSPDTYLFRLQYEGYCSAVIKGQTRSLEPGSLLLLAPGDRYDLNIEVEPNDNGKIAPISDYYLYCDGSWIDTWWANRKQTDLVKISLDESVLGIWKQLNLEKRKPEENKEITDYLLRILCLNMDRMLAENANHLPEHRSFLVYRMKNFIEEHATESFHLQDVADFAGLSVSRTVTLFKEMFGKTVMQHTMDVRLSIALERMQYNKMTLEQIAETCGFGSYSYFFRAFRARYGISPNSYREKKMGL